MNQEIQKPIDMQSNYISVPDLDDTDILNLIDEFRIDIKHQDTHIIAVNYSEGTCLTGTGSHVSAAVKDWAERYNSLHQSGM